MTIGWALVSVVVLALTAFVLRRLHQLNELQMAQCIAGEPVSRFSDVYPCPRLPRWHRRTSTTAAAPAGRTFAYELPTGGNPPPAPRSPSAAELWRVYAQSVDARPGAAPMTPAAVETWRPARPPSIEADFVVPALQSIFTATLAALAAGVAAWALELADPWRLGGGVFVAALLAAWGWRLNVVSSLLAAGERITGADWNHDGAIGRAPHGVLLDPGKARQTVAAERGEREHAATVAALLAFADRCATVGCSERAHGIGASGSERDRYAAQRDALMALGLAEWRTPGSPNAGWRMSVDGETARAVILAHVADI